MNKIYEKLDWLYSLFIFFRFKSDDSQSRLGFQAIIQAMMGTSLNIWLVAMKTSNNP